MIVVTTSWAPDVALRTAGDEPGPGPEQAADEQGQWNGYVGAPGRPYERGHGHRPDRTHQELAAPADVEQPGLEAQGHAKAREDERRGVDERGGQAVRADERLR